jgi:energy-coupling factor transporter ATP-binding protein EcfA2
MNNGSSTSKKSKRDVKKNKKKKTSIKDKKEKKTNKLKPVNQGSSPSSSDNDDENQNKSINSTGSDVFNIQVDLNNVEKENIKKLLLNSETIENIKNELGDERKIKALEKYIKENFIAYELEGATELEELINKNSDIKQWLEDRYLFKEDESCEKKNIFKSFQLALYKPIKDLKKLKLGDFLNKHNMYELKDYLIKIFKNKKEYVSLFTTEIELLMEKNLEAMTKNEKKDLKKQIKKLLEKITENDLDYALDLAKRYKLKKYKKKYKLPKNLKLILKYPKKIRKHFKKSEFKEFINLIEKHCKDSEINPNPIEIFKKCFEDKIINLEFLEHYKKIFKEFEDDFDFFLFFLKFSEEEQRKILIKFSDYFFIPKNINLEYYNKVNLSKSLEEGKKFYSKLEEPPKPCFKDESALSPDPNNANMTKPKKKKKENEFLETLLDHLIGNIKRSENFDYLEIFLKKVKFMKNEINFLNPRFLISYFFSISDSAVRLRSQMNISKAFAIPLTFYDPRFYQKDQFSFRETNYQMSFVISESHSILNLNLGLISKLESKFEKLLNKLFYCKFEESENNFSSKGCVDVNFDHHSDSPRKVSFLNVYGQTSDTLLFEKLEPLVNMVIVQISYFDLFKTKSKNTKLINKIFKICEDKDMPLYLIVRDFKGKIKKIKEKQTDVRAHLNIHSEKMQIFFIKEKDFKKQTISEFETMICNKINSDLNTLNKDKMKMTKPRFRQYILEKDFNELHQDQVNKLNLNMSDEKEKKLMELIEIKKNEKQELLDCFKDSEEFCKKIHSSIVNKKFSDYFFFNKLFLKKRMKVAELREIQHKKNKKDRIQVLEDDISDLKKQIETTKPSKLMEEFFELIMSKNFAIILMLMVEDLRKMNKLSQDPIHEKLNKLKRKLDQCADKDEKIELKEKIREVYTQSLGSAISVEVLFRNLFPYLEENDSWLQNTGRENFKNRLIDLLLNGYSLELIDGENLDFKLKFFVDFMSRIGTSKVCTIGCMGPQSSGKSTLLNYMFGTLFHTSQGRCTSGLYMSIQKIRNPQSQIKYLIIIDSEGLHSAERSDPEYDRKICSFLMNNIDLLMVNVKGEMKANMTKDLEITLYTANKLKSFKKVPEIYFVFNQSNVNNAETIKKLHLQITGMNDSILAGMKISDEKVNEKKLHKFNLDKKYLNVLGNAFKIISYESNSDLGQTQDIVFKKAEKLFGRDSSKLSQKVLDYVLNVPKDSTMKNFGRYFKLSNQGWKMIEKYTDLTNIADIETLNKKFEVKNFIEELSDKFKPSFDEKIDKAKDELQKMIVKTNESDETKTTFREGLKKEITKLEQIIEHWKTKVNMEINKARYSNEIADIFVAKALEELKMKIVSLKIDIKSEANQKIFGHYHLTGPDMIINEGHRLRGDASFKKLSEEDKKKVIDQKFKEVYGNYLNDFTIDSEIGKLEEHKYDVILDLASKKTKLLPEKRLFHKIEEVEEKKCTSLLKKNIIEDDYITVTDEKIRNLDQNFENRMALSKNNFLNIKDKFEIAKRIEYIENISKDFNFNAFIKDFTERFNNLDRSVKFEIEQLYNFAKDLSSYGVELLFINKNDFINKVKKKSNLSMLINNMRSNKKFKRIKIKSIDPKFRKFFDIKTNIVKDKELSKLTNYDYLNVVRNDAIPSSDIKDLNLIKTLKIFINPFDEENQSKVMNAMSSVIEMYFDYIKLFEKIEHICFKMVFNQEPSENIDISKATEISYDMMTRTINQELQIIFDEIDCEMEICGSEMSDIMTGFLIYIASSYIWKFNVQATRKKHENKFKMLRQKEKEFKQYFYDTAIDNKEAQSMIFFTSELGKFIIKNNQNEINRLKKKIIKKVKKIEVVNEYNSENIVKLLRKKYFYNTNKGMFKDTFKFMKNPNHFISAHIDELNKKYFDEEIKKSNKARSNNLKKNFSRIICVLELLKEKFLKPISKNKYTVLSYFRLYTDSISPENEITKRRQKKDFTDELAQYSFDLLFGVLENKKIQRVRSIESKSIVTEFIISQSELDSLHNDIKSHAEYDSFREDMTKSLSPFLSTFFEKAVKSNKNTVYDFKLFFDDLIRFLKEKIDDKQNTKIEKDDPEIKGIFDIYQITSKGCVRKCRFCQKKCDHPDDTEHKCHANNLGHQPRVFSGGHILKKDNKKYASKITCDLVDQFRKVQVNGVEMTWQEALLNNKKNDWAIESGKSIQEFEEQIDNYEKMWKIHGEEICKDFGMEDDHLTIREFIDQYNQNLRDVPSHYILVIDESGSMWGKNFNDAIDGVRKFIEYLKGSIMKNICYITLILFDHKARVIHEAVQLDQLPPINVTINGGGTNFSPVLKQCIASIYANQSRADLTRIIFYTDGEAYYPEQTLNKIRDMIYNEKMDLKLHWMSADSVSTSDPGNVFNKSIKLLGSTNCTLDSKVLANHTGEKFIEIFNLDD